MKYSLMTAFNLDYFDRLYADSDDPWSMRTRWYEHRKRELVLASLTARSYAQVYEPGCGTGDLTLALAARAENLLATDCSARALGIAQERLQHLKHVTLRQAVAPTEWPGQHFDLIVLSEFAFYLGNEQLLALQRQTLASLSEKGILLACHWRRNFLERTQSTEEIHDWFNCQETLTRLVHHEEADFLLDIWSRKPASVAQQEGFA